MKYKHTLALIWTQYTLMLYMLIIDDWKKTLLFLYKGRIGSDIIKKIHEKGGRFFCGYWLTYLLCLQVDNIVFKAFRFLIEELINVFLQIWIRIIGKDNIYVYGYEHVFGALACLNAGCHFEVIEDGMASYNSKEKTEMFWRKYSSRYAKPEKFLSGGWSDAVEKVILTGRQKTPIGLEGKTRIVNMKMMWDNIDIARKKEIFYIFNFKLQRWQEIVAGGRDIIFLTQNLSPMWMEEDNEISLIRELLSEYDHKRIIIKIHPADKKDYDRLFPKCLIVRDTFPVELLWLECLPIKKVVGIYSTALYGTWPEEMVTMREDLLKKYARPEMKNM